jgi:hypothetical protein
MDLIPVENHKDLSRDPFTGAIINSNGTEQNAYLSNYNRLKKEQEELKQLKDNVATLSSDMNEIKSLLKSLVREKNDDN